MRQPFARRSARLAAVLIGVTSVCAPSLRAEEPADSSSAAPERTRKFERMKELIDATVLESTDQPPKTFARSERAILHYSNPISSATAEGATFLWLDGKRPMAAVSMSFRAAGQVFWELSSLSDGPLNLTRDGSTVWIPASCSRKAERLADAEKPADSPAKRLIQMRGIARKFVMQEFRREKWQDGRLLSQPLYRWDDVDRGVLDGAVFGYAETNDPELLLQIEARREGAAGDAAWYFSFAKMTSSPVTVSLDDKEIFRAEHYWKNPRSPEDPYVEARIAVEPEGPPAN
jgi:hypothetical protein